MKIIVPNYYKHFKCIADRCRHNCCIGWEIDIDGQTVEKYLNLDGALGNKLRDHISTEGTPHFILEKDERCPFLMENNLCEIICELGEAHLCDICTAHPRFRNEFSGHTEMGIGLCCEAAADLILNQKEKTVFSPSVSVDSEEEAFFSARDLLIRSIQDRTVPIERRIPCEFPNHDWKKIFRRLERLDPAWEDKIEKIDLTMPLREEWSGPLEQLAVYFVYRHLAGALEDGLFAERIAFCSFSVRVIHSIADSLSELPEIARLYSAEIEYSDENIDLLLNRLR